MQDKDDLAAANTSNERRNAERHERRINARHKIVQYEAESQQTGHNSDGEEITSNKRNPNETALKRFKEKIFKKSSKAKQRQTNKMAAQAKNSNNGPENFEENENFERHIYEVPFASSKGSNVNGISSETPHPYSSDEEQHRNHTNFPKRNSSTNRRYSEHIAGVATGISNGSVKTTGLHNHDGNIFENKKANDRRKPAFQGQSMTLPASRSSRPACQIPLPNLVAGNGRKAANPPVDTSSEDSSSDDWIDKLPVVKPNARKILNVRTQSLPSPSKLDLNYQFLNGLNEMCKCGWYWGPLNSKEAEMKLHGKPDGTFLVRDSNDNRYLLSLSFRSQQRTLHTRIEFCKGKFSFYAAPFISAGCFESVVELIDNCVETSKKRIFCYTKGRALNGATFPVRLTKPLSRFEYVCSLQHLCRFVIRQHFTLENISDMPLPGLMKRYLGKNHFDAKPG